MSGVKKKMILVATASTFIVIIIALAAAIEVEEANIAMSAFAMLTMTTTIAIAIGKIIERQNLSRKSQILKHPSLIPLHKKKRRRAETGA